MSELQRPPIGLIPHHIWMEQRLDAIEKAVKRYRDSGATIPDAWFTEYGFIMGQLGKMRLRKS